MRVSIWQDSHRFDFNNKSKKLVLWGVLFENETPLLANSDWDVVLHAITNAISWVTGVNILWEIADNMCEEWITDSVEYIKEALKYLNFTIKHISISIECLKPKISIKIPEMKKSIASILNLYEEEIWITATSWEWLTLVWKGEWISVFACITFK